MAIRAMRRAPLTLDPATEMTAVAARYVGLKEKPVGSNLTPFGASYGWNGVAWCMIMMREVAVWAGQSKAVPKTASCAQAVAWFRRRKLYSRKPRAGALVFYGPGGGSHVELVVNVTPTHIYTIGGNTSGFDPKGNINPAGDGVYYKPVARDNQRIHGYGMPPYGSARQIMPGAIPALQGARPPYPKVILKRGSKGPSVYAWQGRLLQLGFPVRMSGAFDADTVAATVGFQQIAQVVDDGEVGPITWKAGFA